MADRPKIICGPTRTKQAYKGKVDINQIVARHAKTGMIDHLNSKRPFYGDVSGLGGLQESIDKVREAEELFMQMSATIRKKFENNPVNMVKFLEDPKNREEAISLGMIKKPPEVPPNPPAA